MLIKPADGLDESLLLRINFRCRGNSPAYRKPSFDVTVQARLVWLTVRFKLIRNELPLAFVEYLILVAPCQAQRSSHFSQLSHIFYTVKIDVRDESCRDLVPRFDFLLPYQIWSYVE